MPKRGILDPQGQAVRGALASLGLGAASEVRVGKLIELRVAATDRGQAAALVEEACRRLLANPVMEEYRFTVEEEGA